MDVVGGGGGEGDREDCIAGNKGTITKTTNLPTV